jgi:hypothetical protein
VKSPENSPRRLANSGRRIGEALAHTFLENVQSATDFDRMHVTLDLNIDYCGEMSHHVTSHLDVLVTQKGPYELDRLGVIG